MNKILAYQLTLRSATQYINQKHYLYYLHRVTNEPMDVWTPIDRMEVRLFRFRNRLFSGLNKEHVFII
jgi:hypothetical protein